ncbi:RlpA-like double-psi beta-barrel-protein domain-containing protein-containing protein [Entophlyctis helioformis]|nr:RlpA-like double-psi beta-barrel-protein domain-containing protein-containing protein [Entophlyctis helioformis]
MLPTASLSLCIAALSTLLASAPASASAFKGSATWFNNPADAPGSCGVAFNDADMIAAVSGDLIKGYQDPAYCGKFASVTSNGKTIKVQLLDTCPDCVPTSLDLSPMAFKALEPNLDIGVLDIKWTLVDDSASKPSTTTSAFTTTESAPLAASTDPTSDPTPEPTTTSADQPTNEPSDPKTTPEPTTTLGDSEPSGTPDTTNTDEASSNSQKRSLDYVQPDTFRRRRLFKRPNSI